MPSKDSHPGVLSYEDEAFLAGEARELARLLTEWSKSLPSHAHRPNAYLCTL
jgi:hypothetical protein